MSNLHNRIKQLEKKKQVKPDVYTIHKIDYRAGIIPEVPDPEGVLIPVRLVDMKHEAEDAKQ